MPVEGYPLVFKDKPANENSAASATYDIGTKRVYDGKEYTYIYNSGLAPIHIGHCAQPGAVAYNVLHNSTSGYALAGIAETIISGVTYGWIVTNGAVSCSGTTDNAGALGDNLAPNGSGLLTEGTAAPYFGTALEVNTTATFYLAQAKGVL